MSQRTLHADMFSAAGGGAALRARAARAAAGLLAMLALMLPLAAWPADQAARPFRPPPQTALPDGPLGEIVRQGERIFMHTRRYAADYVGNGLTCVNCHIDAGRRPDSAPMWAAYVSYPAYRSKNRHVNTLAERIQGCFTYSMNGKAPAQDTAIMTALQTYMYWLAYQAPTGVELDGQGYPTLPAPASKADYLRGQSVYAQNCALCHGENGQGQKTRAGQWVFPALWGPDSFNWGAGMHQLNNAAGFIKHNMPLGQGGLLSDQQAWDVAYFMNGHERPQDPRYKGNLAETRRKYHNNENSLYGLEVQGRTLGADAPPAGGRLRAAAH